MTTEETQVQTKVKAFSNGRVAMRADGTMDEERTVTLSTGAVVTWDGRFWPVVEANGDRRLFIEWQGIVTHYVLTPADALWVVTVAMEVEQEGAK